MNQRGLRFYDGTNIDDTASGITGGVSAKVAQRWSGSKANYFVGGVKGADKAFDGGIGLANSLLIGNYGPDTSAGALSGAIKNVRIWTRALSDAEIAAQ